MFKKVSPGQSNTPDVCLSNLKKRRRTIFFDFAIIEEKHKYNFSSGSLATGTEREPLVLALDIKIFFLLSTYLR